MAERRRIHCPDCGKQNRLESKRAKDTCVECAVTRLRHYEPTLAEIKAACDVIKIENTIKNVLGPNIHGPQGH